MIPLLYSWFKVAITLGIIWPLSSLLAEKVHQRYAVTNVRLPDLVQIVTPGLNNLIKPFSRIKDLASFSSSFYGAFMFNIYRPDLFDDFVNFMCGIITVRCIFFLVTILPTSAAGGYSKSRLERIVVGGCHDLVFSGHVAHYYSAMLFLQHHGFVAPGLFPFWGAVLVGIVSIILRDHYTVDVLVAFPVVWAWRDYMLK